jgi:hypothetical protein
MDAVTYDVQVRRRRGRWVASVPALPGDAPKINTSALGNVAADMIEALAEYLGVPATQIDVRVPHPRKATRTPLRTRVTHGAVQLAGGGVALAGLYAWAGTAATLLAAGIGIAAVATGKEAGWL